MTTSVLEVVELPNGDVVLRRCGEEGESLATIKFSSEVKDYFGDSITEIGKIMMSAGLHVAGKMHGDVGDESTDELDEFLNETPTVLH